MIVILACKVLKAVSHIQSVQPTGEPIQSVSYLHEGPNFGIQRESH